MEAGIALQQEPKEELVREALEQRYLGHLIRVSLAVLLAAMVQFSSAVSAPNEEGEQEG